jgi:ABC-type branched-subunit amino acid transport system ATPase component
VRAINAAGVSILMVEQKARQCLAMADYGYVLDQGRNRLEGTGQALLSDADVVRLYLGVRREGRGG